MLRKPLAFILILFTVLATFTAAAGETYQETNRETGYMLVIRDDAGLLSEEEIRTVADSMRPILRYADAGFLTYPADGTSSMNSATKAQEWGDDVFGPDRRFTVFIIDMKNRHLDIYASRPLAGVLTAAEENSISDNVYRDATWQRYASCARSAFSQIEKVLRGEKIAMPMKHINNALLALIVSLLGTFILVSAWARREQALKERDVVIAASGADATVVLENGLNSIHNNRPSGSAPRRPTSEIDRWYDSVSDGGSSSYSSSRSSSYSSSRSSSYSSRSSSSRSSSSRSSSSRSSSSRSSSSRGGGSSGGHGF